MYLYDCHFFWINRRLLTLLVIDVQYVEQLKENVTEYTVFKLS